MNDDIRRLKILAVLFCAFLTFLVYSNVLNAPFIYDDGDNIVFNQDIPSFRRLAGKMARAVQEDLAFEEIYAARPVTFLTFAANYKTSGLNPYGYHLFNVALHALTALLVFLILQRFLAASGIENLWLAFGGALIFAVHPLQTDAVSFVSNRSDVLATFFYLASFLAFLEARASGGIRRWSWRSASWASFAFSFYSKEIGSTLPALLLLYDFLFLSEGDPKKLLREWRTHLPYWAMLALFVLIRRQASSQMGYFFGFTFPWTKQSYALTQVFVVKNYLKMLIFPAGQCLDHWIEPAASFRDPRVYRAAGMLLGGILAAAAFFWRSPYRKLALFAGAWFFIALLPTSSFLPINDAMCERRIYLPSVGVALGMVCFLLWVFRIRPEESGGSRVKPLFFSLAVLVVLLGSTAWKRNAIYADPALLWKEAVERYPRNYRALHNYGNILVERGGRLAEAETFFRRELELNPHPFKCYVALGVVAAQQKKLDEAEQWLLKAVQDRPQDAEPWNRLGLLYYERKEYPKSIEAYRNSLERFKEDAGTYFNLALAYEKAGEDGKALEMFDQAARRMSLSERVLSHVERLRKKAGLRKRDQA